MLSRFALEEECEFELVEYKLPTEIEILPIPESIIEDIEKNGKEADLNGIQFTVTYDDGSTYTHELNGKRINVSEGGGSLEDGSFVVYEMDCWDLDKNRYRCIPDFEKNTITIYSDLIFLLLMRLHSRYGKKSTLPKVSAKYPAIWEIRNIIRLKRLKIN